MSTIIENKLRQAVRERRIVFEEDVAPNPRTAKRLREIEADVEAGCNMSGPFEDYVELEKHLNSL